MQPAASVAHNYRIFVLKIVQNKNGHLLEKWNKMQFFSSNT